MLTQRSENNSKFYMSHLSNTIVKQGKHEQLSVYVALDCFPLENKQYTDLLTSNLFCWDIVGKVMSKRSDLIKVKYDCVAYLFELCYNLMLSAASNISHNPEFEMFTGQHQFPNVIMLLVRLFECECNKISLSYQSCFEEKYNFCLRLA